MDRFVLPREQLAEIKSRALWKIPSAYTGDIWVRILNNIKLFTQICLLISYAMKKLLFSSDSCVFLDKTIFSLLKWKLGNICRRLKLILHQFNELQTMYYSFSK